MDLEDVRQLQESQRMLTANQVVLQESIRVLAQNQTFLQDGLRTLTDNQIQLIDRLDSLTRALEQWLRHSGDGSRPQ